jgi:hypothetical protein
MGIRGTDTATDAITDLNAHSELFEGGWERQAYFASATATEVQIRLTFKTD